MALLTVEAAGARLRAFTWVTGRSSESPVSSTGALKHCCMTQGNCRALLSLKFRGRECLQSRPEHRKRWLLFSADALNAFENGWASCREGEARRSPFSALPWDNDPSASLRGRSAIQVY